MKSFKTLISEVAQPSERGAEEEQAFKDQHTYEVIPHPVALDHQFTGDIPQPSSASRRADQEGSANYDTAYAYGMNALMDKAFATEEVNEDAAQEIPMMSQQLDFIGMAAKAIKESLKGGGDPEEWYQGKLGTAHDAMKTLHANIKTGSVDESEMATKKALDDASASSKEGKKAVSLKKAPWDKTEALVGGQKELDHDKDGDIDGDDFAKLRAKKKKKNESVEELEEYSNWKIQHPTKSTKSYTVKARNTAEAIKKGHAAAKKAGDMHAASDDRMFKPKHIQKESLDETTMSAIKKPVTMTTVDGKTRTVMKTTKDNKTDDNGQDKITTNEGTESLDEAFKAGIVKLKDNSSMVLKKEDADVLNKLFKKMSSGSVKKMTETAMKDKSGFAEILSFAKEAL